MNHNNTNGTTALLGAAVSIALALIVGCSAGAGSLGTVPPRASSDAEPSESASPSPTAPATATPSGAAPSPTARTPTTQPGSKKIDLKAYFLLYAGSDESAPTLVPVNREVDSTVAVARAAMRALLSGPTDDERAHNLELGTIGTGIPARTTLLGVSIQNRVATVDLSREFESGGDIKSMSLRLAQVVYTLTQFPTVDRVSFRVDGQPMRVIDGAGRTVDGPVGRGAYVDVLPAIFVDQPAWEASATNPLIAAGKANVFEAQFMAALVDGASGRILVQRSVMATCGTGCWGDFRVQFAVASSWRQGDLRLRVWEPSARDGSPTNVREYPLD